MGKLLEVSVEGDTSSAEKNVLFGFTPLDNDSLWRTVEAAGFELKTVQRNAAGKEKGVDTCFVVKIMDDLYTAGMKDEEEIIIVAGDADYLPVANAIHDQGKQLIVVFWNNVSMKLKTWKVNISI